jgi:hypothetical protein
MGIIDDDLERLMLARRRAIIGRSLNFAANIATDDGQRLCRYADG